MDTPHILILEKKALEGEFTEKKKAKLRQAAPFEGVHVVLAGYGFSCFLLRCLFYRGPEPLDRLSLSQKDNSTRLLAEEPRIGWLEEPAPFPKAAVKSARMGSAPGGRGFARLAELRSAKRRAGASRLVSPAAWAAISPRERASRSKTSLGSGILSEFGEGQRSARCAGQAWIIVSNTELLVTSIFRARYFPNVGVACDGKMGASFRGMSED
ncbi:hypothetical protein KSP39_PZI004630 [Platanthera zijinensis]|uniref:Uncharacterized protein n=1 Tax=Platanthera zijinensis TaxID=2320716 RepID=A0AAP0BXX0_9ASPA